MVDTHVKRTVFLSSFMTTSFPLSSLRVTKGSELPFSRRSEEDFVGFGLSSDGVADLEIDSGFAFLADAGLSSVLRFDDADIASLGVATLFGTREEDRRVGACDSAAMFTSLREIGKRRDDDDDRIEKREYIQEEIRFPFLGIIGLCFSFLHFFDF